MRANPLLQEQLRNKLLSPNICVAILYSNVEKDWDKTKSRVSKVTLIIICQIASERATNFRNFIRDTRLTTLSAYSLILILNIMLELMHAAAQVDEA